MKFIEGTSWNTLLKNYYSILLVGKIQELKSALETIKEQLHELYGEINYIHIKYPKSPDCTLLSNATLFSKNVFIIEDIGENATNYLDTISAKCIQNRKHVIFLGEKILNNSMIVQEFIHDPQKLVALISKTLEEKVLSALRRYSIKHNQKIVVLIAKNVTNDDTYINTEIQGLHWYLHDKIFNEHEIEQYCINYFNVVDANFICNQLLQKNFKKYVVEIIKIQGDQSFIFIIRVLLKNFSTLLFCKTKIDSIPEVKQALSVMENNIPYKEISYLKKYVSIWTRGQIKTVLNKLICLEIECKHNNNIGRIKQFFIALIPNKDLANLYKNHE